MIAHELFSAKDVIPQLKKKLKKFEHLGSLRADTSKEGKSYTFTTVMSMNEKIL